MSSKITEHLLDREVSITLTHATEKDQAQPANMQIVQLAESLRVLRKSASDLARELDRQRTERAIEARQRARDENARVGGWQALGGGWQLGGRLAERYLASHPQLQGGTLDTVFLQCDKPATTFCRKYAINGPCEVNAGKYGGCFRSGNLRMAYDSGTPADGEGWGPKPGQWTLSKNYPTVAIVDGAAYDTTNKFLYGQFDGVIQRFIGKLAGSLSQGGTATVNIWAGAGGSEVVISSFTLSGASAGRDWLMKSGATAIASGKKVAVEFINGIAYITEAECA